MRKISFLTGVAAVVLTGCAAGSAQARTLAAAEGASASCLDAGIVEAKAKMSRKPGKSKPRRRWHCPRG